MNAETFNQHCVITPHQYTQLQTYAEMLEQWNARINLIGKSTQQQIWERHFLDCAALIAYLPKQPTTVLDIGSGAGFPGLVLSILSDHPVTLVESLGKKATFLREVKLRLSLSCSILHTRAENLPTETKYAILTARAVAPLEMLWRITEHVHAQDCHGLFLKGEQAAAEIETFQQEYPRHQLQRHPHPHSAGCIVTIQT